ncbi:MAG TPA: hypothetical protein VFV38_05790 [Ktedonobacteraceae bacterium]|nr:hypothetical protein [Ktedonobacteraceae bacterium]
MSLHPILIGLLPEETARIAQAVLRKGNLCMCLRKVLESIYEDKLFADPFSPTGGIEG